MNYVYTNDKITRMKRLANAFKKEMHNKTKSIETLTEKFAGVVAQNDDKKLACETYAVILCESFDDCLAMRLAVNDSTSTDAELKRLLDIIIAFGEVEENLILGLIGQESILENLFRVCDLWWRGISSKIGSDKLLRVSHKTFDNAIYVLLAMFENKSALKTMYRILERNSDVLSYLTSLCSAISVEVNITLVCDN